MVAAGVFEARMDSNAGVLAGCGSRVLLHRTPNPSPLEGKKGMGMMRERYRFPFRGPMLRGITSGCPGGSGGDQSSVAESSRV